MSGKIKGLILAIMFIAITLGAYGVRAETGITFTSLTHPDQTKWYKTATCLMTWDVTGNNGYSFVVDQSPNTVPDQTVDISPGSWSLLDGINYFHVRARLTDGSWSDTANYTVKVDTVAPVIKSVEIDGGAPKCYSLNVGISIDAYDATSYVESVRISPSVSFSGITAQPYQYYMPWSLAEPSPNNPGTTYRRYAYVVAIDAAGNSTPLTAHSDYIDYENPCPT